MINIKGWGALSFYTCDWHSQYCWGRLKSVFIVARNVQHIIMKSKSTKAPLIPVFYNHRNHGVSSNLSQKFTILWEIQKDLALSFLTYDWRSEYNEWRLKTYTHVFIIAKNVQHIILKSKSTKAPLMSVLYIQRDHGVSSNVSQKFTIFWEIYKDVG